MKYTLSEIKDIVKSATEVEIYKYSDNTYRLHSDFIESVDVVNVEELPFDGQGLIDADIELMDEERYNETICANTDIEYSDMYDEADKVAVIVVRTWNTFDVVFNTDNSSNEKGFIQTRQYCIDYIKQYNGTSESYFHDYKGGTVQVVCNETGAIVYSEAIK